MPAKLGDLDPRLQKILLSYPVRSRVAWHKKDGIVTISYRKNFTRFERRLHRWLGGPTIVKRPMDEKSSIVWELSDGRNSIKDICDVLDERYREEIEPVLEYVHNVLLVLLERNLVRLEVEKPSKPLLARKQRVLKRIKKD
jgi:hypothetical protein